ncbi:MULTISPECIES: molybdopterin cofactor-binding domain-containing protein [unclassified Massilia]|uniref:xanthine dehydrogenase family protein molybdopterin-binding subunit n=1 Tax=unclassified Massilia TaxID=2609279 RepID=UPI00177E8A2D|nr:MULTISPECIES: molybdopterin cofactor-binding domain-containing protein [unclassified Massilia]MBD8528856.1 xanthine dehydrogenase family protein molybdopterin-binding subunit [Massilia sp. CFBP 13647]MBD8673498.1 xanthine dehydrogenase family protein molybdopterin-binding subunit [Massilia sp. CFBP 13721]
MSGAHDPARRRLLAAGALTLAFTIGPAWPQGADKGSKQKANKLPGSLDKEPWLDAWIRIDAHNRVTVFTGKAELGQGIKTALLQVAAEELQVAPARITLVTADTGRTPDEGYTAGSHSMQDSGTALRHAAAEVRAILTAMAAQRLQAPADSLRLADGALAATDGRRVTYGELLEGRQLHRRADGKTAPREARLHTIAGKALRRVDIPAKVGGGVAYVHDLRLPGMVHARVVRPPAPAARLLGVDTAAVARLPGVLKVVRDGRFLAVIADGEYRAVKAAAALAAAARWETPATLPAQLSLREQVLSQPAQALPILERGVAPAAGRTLRATYTRPFQLHGAIGPSCAIARFDAGRYTVWTHSQGVFPLRTALAELLGVDEETVRCIHVEGSGCYGHNGADDVAADAALLARAFPGRPVRVQWMREDEHGWEPFGPGMVATVEATLDARGAIAWWNYEVWSPSHNTRPGKAGNLLAATHLARPFVPPPAKPIPQPEGSGDRNAIPYYVLPQARVVHHFQPQSFLRTSALRSLGAYCNVFAIESFMDELAQLANADPVAFRLRHLDDPRALEVVRLAASRFGWDGYRAGPRRARGFAFARYKNLAAYCAIALEVEVARETGFARITRAVAAVDCGEVVNPDGVRNQIEGGIVQSASWTLLEQVRFDQAQVLTRDWAAYPILRFNQVPDRIEVHLIDRPGMPFLGTGEASQGPAAAALANAMAGACKVRLRDLPLDRARVRGTQLSGRQG